MAANRDPEPVVGHPSCPNLAEYGFRHARCIAFLTFSLDDAVRHQRSQHFDHRPFMCIPPSGRPW